MPGVDAKLDALVALIAGGEVLVLSGAGLSTESGIPDYRGVTGRLRPARPMTYQEFVGSAESRRRYWARSHLGWRNIARAQPNSGHRAVADLQHGGRLSGIVTQNVDGLHQAADAHGVIELHGGLDRVICLSCGACSSRAELHSRLAAANAGWDRLEVDSSRTIKPDGDGDVVGGDVLTFRTVDCLECGDGVLKPDVVFFGENVPPERVSFCYALVETSRLLLVLGSSLTVASGFRFVRRAANVGVTVIIVNQGATRGDGLAEFRIDAPTGRVLAEVVHRAAVLRRFDDSVAAR